MSRRLQIVAVALLAGFSLSACGSEKAPSGAEAGTTVSDSPSGTGKDADRGDRKTSMDMQGAAERADGMLDTVLGKIDPEVEWAHGPTTKGSCDVTRRRTVMTIVSEDRRQDFLDQIEGIWRTAGYRIKAKNTDPVFPAVYAVTKDGFGISVSIRARGQAFFEADTPCVKESTVADSTTRPKGKDYRGVYPLPAPNVRSGHWSGGGSA
ncbi:hypothetical protein [Streptomyces sp. NPDC057682]|uniref:hypothetical protein n=1 Tax=unclassified Streptomyces TaxID=2593676 RepID=UPI003648731F